MTNTTKYTSIRVQLSVGEQAVSLAKRARHFSKHNCIDEAIVVLEDSADKCFGYESW